MKRVLLILFLNIYCFANVGKISALQGDVSIQRSNTSLQAVTGMILEEKDVLTTSKNSKIQIILTDNTIISIGQ
ncbi:MAG: hypothetical protein WHU93_07225, partial [Arcobacteraceae bacterium]